MSLSSIIDLIGRALAALQRFKDLILGTPSQAANAAIEEANKDNKAAADIARQTEAKADDEIASAQREGDDELARVRAADSLRNQQRLVQQAIDRANKRPGADSVVRRK